MYYTFMHLYTKFVTTHLLTVLFTFSDTIMPSTFNNFKNTENNDFFLSNHSYHSLISKNTSSHCPAFPTLSNTHTNGPALAPVLHQTSITIGICQLVSWFVPQLHHALHYCSLLLKWIGRHSGMAPALNLTGPISLWLDRLRLISSRSISYTCRC